MTMSSCKILPLANTPSAASLLQKSGGIPPTPSRITVSFETDRAYDGHLRFHLRRSNRSRFWVTNVGEAALEAAGKTQVNWAGRSSEVSIKRIQGTEKVIGEEAKGLGFDFAINRAGVHSETNQYACQLVPLR